MSEKKLHEESVFASPIGTRDTPAIDIFSIHERQAGRLVLDPAWVRTYIAATSNNFFLLQVKLEKNSETNWHPSWN